MVDPHHRDGLLYEGAPVIQSRAGEVVRRGSGECRPGRHGHVALELAVVGTGIGTEQIVDGSRITIDGGQGIVRLES